MRFRDENCGNCKFYLTNSEWKYILNTVPEIKKELEDGEFTVDEDIDSLCLRYPGKPRYVFQHNWCGEHIYEYRDNKRFTV